MAVSSGSSKSRGEYLLHERPLRKMLSNMYAAIIGSVANSRMIIETLPGDIGEDCYEGNDLTRLSMKSLCEWLGSVYVLTKDAKAFGQAFLDPIRTAAEMRLEMSREEPSSTTVEGLVFAKMAYNDKAFKSERIVLQVIVPDLQAPMTVRVSKDDESVRHGYYVFEKCQPMPLVNRMHQTTGKMSPSRRTISLAEFDYIYTALADISHLERSLEMECFCEVPSTDAKRRRRLAAPFVTFGTVQMVRGQSISIRSLDETRTVQMAATEQISELSRAPPCDFEGKAVRLLGAQWYEPSGGEDGDAERPVIYAMESDKIETLRVQEECGKVRLRGSVGLNSVPAPVRKSLSALRCISCAGSAILYSYRTPNDEIKRYFVKAHSGIRKKRASGRINAVQIKEEQVIDKIKSSIKGLISLSTSKKYNVLSRVLLDRIMQGDISGEYDVDVSADRLQMKPNQYRRQVSFLRHLGIGEKGGNSWSVTKKGKQVAEGIALKIAGSIPAADVPQVMHPDALLKHGIAPSLALNMLENQQLKNFTRVVVEGCATGMFWERVQEGGTPAGGESTVQYKSLRASVLSAMGSVAHPLAVPKIAEIVRASGGQASAYMIGLLLSNLANEGQKPVRRDGDTWAYSTTARVRDLFEKYTDSIMSTDDVVEKINVGAVRRDEVAEAIEEISMSGIVVRLDGRFTHNSGIESKREMIARADTKKLIVGMFKKRNSIDDDEIIAAVTRTFDAAGDTRSAMDKMADVRQTLNEMEAEGIIWFNGRMVVKESS